MHVNHTKTKHAQVKIVSAIIILCLLVLVLPSYAADTHNAHKEQAHQESVHQESVHKEKTEHAPADKKSADSHHENEKASKSEAPAAENKTSKVLPSDVRVLIDISGSMKKTDPKNLRKPALNLITRLLPDKSKAGIWSFGQTVNQLMPLSVVDAEWRKQAAPKSNEINSSAVFTNIGKALEEVTPDLKHLSADYKTHIILLTDGVVDISKEAVENVKERDRILTELLPSLKSAGYTVHTIALSADADADLLKKISISTDGVYTTAQSADELTSTFLKIFDQAVPAERVPLENNGFLVDPSIKEFTALIFRKSGVDKSIIIAPDGTEFSTTSSQDEISWYRTDQYDLITASNPKPGQWKIKTEIAPQSRVTVVSNLRLIVEPLKNNLRLNDNLSVSYSFIENDKTITNKDFLGLLESSVVIAKEGSGESNTIDLTMPIIPEDGMYNKSITDMKDAGDYEMHLYIDGKTFKREYKHSFSIIGSLLSVTNNNVAAADGNFTHNYKVVIDEKLADLKKVQVTATIKDSHNNSQNKVLSLIEGKRWEFSFSPSKPAEYHVSVHAQGELRDGSKLDETADAETFIYQKAEENSAKEEPTEEKHEEATSGEKNNLLLYISIGVGNLVVIILAFFAYRMWKGGNDNDEFAEMEKTLAMDKKSIVKEMPSAKTKEKKGIDLAADDVEHISINDDLMSESAFPLDSMEDTHKDEISLSGLDDLNDLSDLNPDNKKE